LTARAIPPAHHSRRRTGTRPSFETPAGIEIDSDNGSKGKTMTNIQSQQHYEIGMVGLGVVGRNLLLNMADRGFSTAGFDEDHAKVEALREESKDRAVSGTTDMKKFIALLGKPRAVMMLVPAGDPVDSVIKDLLPHLDKGDLLITLMLATATSKTQAGALVI
jgi:sorbitol-specific phosphotransferase system component IIBC